MCLFQFSAIYRGKYVAVKEPRIEEPSALLQLQEELSILTQLKDLSSHVVPVYGGDLSSKSCFIVMKLFPDGSLAQALKEMKAPLPLRQVKAVSLQISYGMKAIHDLNIIHRDLKVRSCTLMDFVLVMVCCI